MRYIVLVGSVALVAWLMSQAHEIASNPTLQGLVDALGTP